MLISTNLAKLHSCSNCCRPHAVKCLYFIVGCFLCIALFSLGCYCIALFGCVSLFSLCADLFSLGCYCVALFGCVSFAFLCAALFSLGCCCIALFGCVSLFSCVPPCLAWAAIVLPYLTVFSDKIKVFWKRRLIRREKCYLSFLLSFLWCIKKSLEKQ